MDFPPQVRTVSALEELPDPLDVFEVVARRLWESEVRSRVRRLPAPERLVVIWRYGLVGENLSCPQVDARLGMRTGAAERLERRALKRLRGELEQAS